jgi:hypothetical protein
MNDSLKNMKYLLILLFLISCQSSMNYSSPRGGYRGSLGGNPYSSAFLRGYDYNSMTGRNNGFFPMDTYGGNYRNINSFQSFGDGGGYYGNSSFGGGGGRGHNCRGGGGGFQ